MVAGTLFEVLAGLGGCTIAELTVRWRRPRCLVAPGKLGISSKPVAALMVSFSSVKPLLELVVRPRLPL